MKTINSNNLILSRFKFRLDLKAKQYRQKSFICYSCFTRVEVFYKKLPKCTQKPCPFCGADFYIYSDTATYMLKKHISRYLQSSDLEHNVKTIIRVLKGTNHIKDAKYEITNDYVKVVADGKTVMVPR